MQVICTSDFHGNLPINVIPEGDILLIAGDICPAYHTVVQSIPMQQKWLESKFLPWIKSVKEKNNIKDVVLVAGNHDWILSRKHPRDICPGLNEEIIYLQDSFVEINGLKIYGSPWQLPFCDWAFNKSEIQLEVIWESIPKDTDILLSHSPPYGILDITTLSNENIGSHSLLKKIKEIKPKLVVFGHNHSGYGIHKEDDITFINATLLDEQYQMVNKPISIEI